MVSSFRKTGLGIRIQGVRPRALRFVKNLRRFWIVSGFGGDALGDRAREGSLPVELC